MKKKRREEKEVLSNPTHPFCFNSAVLQTEEAPKEKMKNFHRRFFSFFRLPKETLCEKSL
jgi:hypothetical protein